MTKDRIMPSLPHWDAFPNQEAIVIYKSCQLMCLKLWTTMLHDKAHHISAFKETAWVPRILTTMSYLNHQTAESVPFCVCRVHLIFDNTSSTNKNCYFMLLANELVQQSLITFEYHLLEQDRRSFLH